jgi:superfamily I DNA/RNA helicase
VHALECLPGERFDAIVVDEGQDFAEEWWVALQLALSDHDQGILYVFFDDNQRLYHHADAIPQDLDVFPLTRNLRNTRPIHHLASAFYKGWKLEGAGPEGRKPDLIQADTDQDVHREVSRYLHNLVREERVHPEDIAVLTGRSRDKSALGRKEVIGAFSICCGDLPERGMVVFDSIRRFKGLERPVVILVELEEVMDSPETLYVGITRANAHLAVVGSRDVMERIKGIQGQEKPSGAGVTEDNG